MNQIYQPHKNICLFRLSDSAEYYPKNEGLFEVRFRGFMFRTFFTRMDAFLFYLNLDEPATLWDVTEDEKLVERKISMLKNKPFIPAKKGSIPVHR